MKTIYAKDIKAMVKKFNLNEDEEWYLRELANAINKEKGEYCEYIQFDIFYGSTIYEKEKAIEALLVYFGAKVQKENGLMFKFRETTWEISRILKCDSITIGQWLKGVSMVKDRFGKFVECSDTFGLNYLEIDL